MTSQTLTRYELLVYGGLQLGEARHQPTEEGRAEAVARASALAKTTDSLRVQVMAVYSDETCEPVYDTAFPDRRPEPTRPLFPAGAPKRERPSGLAAR